MAEPTDPTCRKCGSMDIATAWHLAGQDCPWGQRTPLPLAEHLHRTCQVCGFHWTDATLDAA